MFERSNEGLLEDGCFFFWVENKVKSISSGGRLVYKEGGFSWWIILLFIFILLVQYYKYKILFQN